MFYCKIHAAGNEKIIALADESVIGKTFSGDNASITVSESFYAGKKCSGSLEKAIRDATIINAVGNEIVGLMIRKKIVERKNVLEIGGVLHAQVVTL